MRKKCFLVRQISRELRNAYVELHIVQRAGWQPHINAEDIQKISHWRFVLYYKHDRKEHNGNIIELQHKTVEKLSLLAHS
jgi:hypothetical protein